MTSTVLVKRLVITFLTIILSVGLALAAQAAPGASLEVKPQYGAAALQPGENTLLEVLITIKAPEIKRAAKRQPVAVSLVLDRSGSMDEAKKLDYAKRAAKILVESLEKDDLFALVIYDNRVQLLHPLGKVAAKDKAQLLKLIDTIRPGGMTFLSGGLEEGIRQLGSVKNEGPARVILLSDGLANEGVTGAEQIAAISARAREKGIGVSSIGLGLDFDEDVMQLLAQRGGGKYYYIADSEYLPRVFEDELALVVNSFTKDLGVTYTMAPAVKDAKVYGYTTGRAGNGTKIEMSDFGSGEERQIMLRLDVAAGSSPGKQELGTLRLGYNSPDDGAAQSLDIPLSLELVADKNELAQLEKDRAASVKEVKDEALLRQADEEHLLAMKELEQGKLSEAKSRLRKQQEAMSAAAPGNVAIANKMERLALDEKNLERASRDSSFQKGMLKSGKSAAYQSAQGSKKGSMLQSGDKGFEVEKLQNALKAQGFYKGEVDGKYSPELEAAVTAYQKSKSLRADGIAGPATMDALGI